MTGIVASKKREGIDACPRCGAHVTGWEPRRDVEIREWNYPLYFARCSSCGRGVVKIKQVEGKPPPATFMAEIQEARGVKGQG